MFGDRIKELRKKLKLSQAEFGAKIGLLQNYIWMIEKGGRTPSDRTVSDISRVYEVNEEWLRDGSGEMFIAKSADEEIAHFLTDVASDPENSARRQLIRIMARLPEETWETVEQNNLRKAERKRNVASHRQGRDVCQTRSSVRQ